MVPVVLIAAVARNNAIGSQGRLPWRLPGDLAHFKAQTMGKPVIMGRRTFASVGRPLPGRHLIVVSRDPALALPAGVEHAASVGEALWRGQAVAAEHGGAEVMVAGGAEIYHAAMDRVDILRITEVDLAPSADTFFPPIDRALWREVSREPQPCATGDEASFSIVTYAASRPLRGLPDDR